MKNICFYFQVHQPYRVSRYSIFDIGTEKEVFTGPDNYNNRQIFEKVAQKCYLPANKLFLQLLKKHPEMRVSYSITGVFLEQCQSFGEIGSKVLESFIKLAETGRVEFLGETYYHSFSSLYSREEFERQVKKHSRLIKKLFKQNPKVFRNTELAYNNDIAYLASKFGFKGALLEGWDPVLQNKSPNIIYKPPKHVVPDKKFSLLLKNYRLSDDIAFRFSNKEWSEHPLTVEKFIHWINANYGDNINLFMDYETFGEHQWEDTGIFEFLKHLPKACKKAKIGFQTPSEAIKNNTYREELDVPDYISWADMERDLSAWLENSMQKSSMERIFAMENEVLKTKKRHLIDTWRKLQTSDHFYYMSTKYWSDGDVHTYFSPFETPYEAFISYNNVVSNFERQVKTINNKICPDQ